MVVPGFGLRAINHGACYRVVLSHDIVLFHDSNNSDDVRVNQTPNPQNTTIRSLTSMALPDILPGAHPRESQDLAGLGAGTPGSQSGCW